MGELYYKIPFFSERYEVVTLYAQKRSEIENEIEFFSPLGGASVALRAVLEYHIFPLRRLSQQQKFRQ